MLISMYHLEPFPLRLRGEFELPAWPYTEDLEDYKLFEDYMKDLKVFRYQDSDSEIDGRDVSRHLNIDLWGEPKLAPFRAYMSDVYVNEDFVPIYWPGGETESEERMQKLRENSVTSDMLAWSSWNVPCNILAYTASMIRREVLTEYLDQNLCYKGRCWSPDKLGVVKK